MYLAYILPFIELVESLQLSAILSQIYFIISVPFFNSDILWTVFPLITTTIIIELYFGSHKEESLGWNSATANGLVLVYVGINIVKDLLDSGAFNTDLLGSQIALGILGMGGLLVFVSFFHILPKEIAFFISSGLVVHYLAFLGVVFIYTGIVYTELTLYAAILIFVALVLFFNIVKYFEPDLD
ncbi:MAG: hypothetical protein K0B07_00225 [DPANN group archaeon]|nr:hypothetical protein [DPANN group archaeon]